MDFGAIVAKGDISGDSIKVSGAEKLKILTAVHTLSADDVSVGYFIDTISAIDLTKVRAVDGCAYSVSEAAVFTFSSHGTGNFFIKTYIATSTNVRMTFGSSWATSDKFFWRIILAE